MEVVLLILAAAVVQAASLSGSDAAASRPNYHSGDASHLFQQFIIKFNKKFNSESEEQIRLKNFKENLEFINKSNRAADKRGSNKVFGVTEFADMSHDEYGRAAGNSVRKNEEQERAYYDINKAEELFEQFVEKYNIKYKDDEEKKRRFKIFKENLIDINAVNKRFEKDEPRPALLGVTEFSDKTHEEFVKLHTGLGDVDTLDEVLVAVKQQPITDMSYFELDDAAGLFENFIKAYKKNYKNEREKQERFENFKKALELINEENQKLEIEGKQPKYGVTAFADMKHKELLNRVYNLGPADRGKGSPIKKRRIKYGKKTTVKRRKKDYLNHGK